MLGCLYYLLLAIFCVQEAGAIVNEVRCGSVDVRNTPQMTYPPPRIDGQNESSADYRDCTIIDGDVSVSMIAQDQHSNDEFPTFESLREVTGSILIFQANSLTTLSKLFPNLRVIGGNSLIMNYALVVYQNPDLKLLNLTKLTTIRNGGVRITENSRLCYAKGIRWEKILTGKIRDYIVDQVAGRCESVCSVEDEKVCELDGDQKPICWSPTVCQKACKRQIDQAEPSGCTDLGEPCHPLCIGGCFEANNPGACYSCRLFDVEGVCVEKCPPGMYAMLKRRCITRQQCLALHPVISHEVQERELRKAWKPFQGICHYECPSGYEPDPDDQLNCLKCDTYCPKTCYTDVVDSIGTALKLAKCNIIGGNLEVDMRIGMESASPEKFTEAFGDIVEVEGYLMIRFSTAFMSLYMFKNLKIIRGKTLWKSMYGLVVFENPNLKQLFSQSGIELVNGKVSFQNNRMLCYKTIDSFVNNMVIHENISDSDVSPFSNGDKAICDEIPLDIRVVSVYAYGFTLGWMPFNTTDMDHRKFLGYQIFYKKVDRVDRNMSIDDDRSACSDSWSMVFVTEGTKLPDKNGTATFDVGHGREPRGELVNTGIEANTLYAVYVQTRLVNHPGAKNAISKIHFIHTIFAVPDSPRTIIAEALDANTLKITWERPLNERGNITHYSLSWLFDQPFAHPNATSLCSMRSQSMINHILPGRPNGMQLKKPGRTSPPGTCPAEFGCCQCDTPAPPVSHLMADAGGMPLIEDSKTLEKSQFENQVQNYVFVQNCEENYDPLRCPDPNAQPSPLPSLSDELAAADAVAEIRKRHINGATVGATTHRRRRETTDDKQRALWQTLKHVFSRQPRKKHEKPANTSKTVENATTAASAGRRRRALPAVPDADEKTVYQLNSEEAETLAETTSTHDAIEDMLLFDPYSKTIEQRLERLRREHPNSAVLYVGRFDEANATEVGNVNVTTMSVVLTGLPHYTVYQVSVIACHDVEVPENFCSTRPAWTFVKTRPIMEYDRVAADSVVLLNVTDGKPTDRKIYWEAPKRPNGIVLTYRVKLYRDDDSTPLEQCISAADFERNKGIMFTGLSAGRYSLEIRVESSLEILGNATVVEDLFEIESPSIFTLRNILIVAGIVILILIISTTLCFRYAAHQVEGKMGEMTQNITNNPDYLSHYNYYSEDDWELNRDDIDLKQKIGSGTFGSVFLGEGKNVLSLCGERFGKCAVKTIPEETNSQDRFLFLCEANVMKQFNTEFIVKLYGVVSNGSPVLIVMEMMEKGNLRDYLRSVRPGGPDNKDSLPPPTLEDYFTWAAQIADGMAYLETKQFCHRDLAARNCMVHANRMVKIGDFGMTRDLYYQEYYRPAGKRMMPVRWMSPEALKDGTFNLRSDIWSYGIVLFEMLTLGEQPYGGMGNDEVFHMIVVQHHVPRKPIDCHPFWYSIMRACWQRDPRRRPYFHQIVRHLQQNASSEFRQLSYVLNELKSNKDVYNFNDLCEDHGSNEHARHKDVDYREKQFYMSSVRAHDGSDDDLAKEKQRGAYAADDTGEARWDPSAATADGNNNEESNYNGDTRASLTSRAIKKAREFGVPFMGRPRQNRLNNYKADKFTVFATLLGFNPRMSKNRKRAGAEKGVDKLAQNENPQSATVRNGNDYTRQTGPKKADVCLEMEKEEEERLKPEDDNSHEEEDDEDFDDEDEIDDEEDEEVEDGSELDESIDQSDDSDVDDNPLQKASFHTSSQPEVKRLSPKPMTAHSYKPQCDYVEADPALRGSDLMTADRMSKRRSASMTSSSSSLRTVLIKSNTIVQKQ